MLNSLRIQNFKSWQDTGQIQFGALTGFFGTNSSGKTSILQFLLMLKQTVESSDRARILHLGDEHSYVELGTIYDIAYNHNAGDIHFDFSFQNNYNPHKYTSHELTEDEKELYENFKYIPLKFKTIISHADNQIYLKSFHYSIESKYASITRLPDTKRPRETGDYILETNINEINKDPRFKASSVDNPEKFYIFPYMFRLTLKDPGYLVGFTHEIERFFRELYYLGPLREYPRRLYTWAGEQTQGVGNRGERAIAALLSSQNQRPTIYTKRGEARKFLEEHVAYWLKELGLIHSFAVRPIAPNRKEYEVRIKRTAESAEVFLTDVGFGVSQLLPVLVLLFYVPEGSTIILEQPEIHLHPAVQAGLADVFIDAIKRRNVQIILESHSEHLLQRLQRRLAEEALPTDQVKLYFTDFVGAASTLTPLDLDPFGNIRNWPKNFFGDSFGEASARMKEEIKRRQAAGEK